MSLPNRWALCVWRHRDTCAGFQLFVCVAFFFWEWSLSLTCYSRERSEVKIRSPYVYKEDVCSIINERTVFFLVNSRKARLCSTESPLQEVKHLEGENLQALQKGFCIWWLKRTDNNQLEIHFSSRSLAMQMEKELRVQFIFYEHYCDRGGAYNSWGFGVPVWWFRDKNINPHLSHWD